MFIFGAAVLGPAADSGAIALCFEQMRRFFAGNGMNAIACCGSGNIRMAMAEAHDGSGSNRQLVDADNYCFVGFGSLFQTTPVRDSPAKDGFNVSTLEDIDSLYGRRGEFVGARASNEGIILFRDHFGTKPLYYFHDPQRRLVLFASSPAALLAAGAGGELNRRALGAFMLGMYPPAGDTVYRAIKSVMPASSVSFAPSVLPIARRHWSPQPDRAWWERNSHAPVEAFRAELVASVVARVPEQGRVALALSGGIDSGAVASIAARHFANTEFLSFTDVLPQGYVGPAQDERADVERLTALFSNISANFVDGLDRDPLSMGGKAFQLWGLPCMNPQSYFYDSMNAQASAKGATVLLGGFGGDQCVSSDARGFLLETLRRGELVMAWRHLKYLSGRFSVPANTLFKTMVLQSLVPHPLVRLRANLLGRIWVKATALRQDFVDATGLEAYLEEGGWTFPSQMDRSMNQVAIGSLGSVLRNGGLGGEPSFSAWHGIDYRFPLYDWQLIDAHLSIPSDFKVAHNKERVLFRDAARPFMPSFIIDRDDKGPGTPYLRTRLLADRQRLSNVFDRFATIPLWREIVDEAKVRQSLSELDDPQAWAITRLLIAGVLQPYFLGDFLERLGY